MGIRLWGISFVFTFISLLISPLTSQANQAQYDPIEFTTHQTPNNNTLVHVHYVESPGGKAAKKHSIGKIMYLYREGGGFDTRFILVDGRVFDAGSDEHQEFLSQGGFTSFGELEKASKSNLPIYKDAFKSSGHQLLFLLSYTYRTKLYYDRLISQTEQEIALAEKMLLTLPVGSSEWKLLNQNISDTYNWLVYELEHNAKWKYALGAGTDLFLNTALMNVAYKFILQSLKVTTGWLLKFPGLSKAVGRHSFKAIGRMNPKIQRQMKRAWLKFSDDWNKTVCRKSKGCVPARVSLGKFFRKLSLKYTLRLYMARHTLKQTTRSLGFVKRLLNIKNPRIAQLMQQYAPLHLVTHPKVLPMLRRELIWAFGTTLASQVAFRKDKFWEQWDEVVQDLVMGTAFTAAYAPWRVPAFRPPRSAYLARFPSNVAWTGIDMFWTQMRVEGFKIPQGKGLDELIDRGGYSVVYGLTSSTNHSMQRDKAIHWLETWRAQSKTSVRTRDRLQVAMVDVMFRAISSVVYGTLRYIGRDQVYPYRNKKSNPNEPPKLSEMMESVAIYKTNEVQPGTIELLYPDGNIPEALIELLATSDETESIDPDIEVISPIMMEP